MAWSERLALLALLLLGGCDDAARPAIATPPAARPLPADAPSDVVLITLDTLRADRLGCYGNDRGLTPNLDRLAREGTRFANAMAPMPCTGPAHAALFTGQEPRRTGVTSNFVRADDSLLTLAERLSALRFATGACFNGFDFAGLNLVQGFDGYGHDKGRRAEKIVPTLKQFLASTAGRRRFCWIHLFIPHGPHDLPDEWARRVTHRYDGPLKDDLATMEKLRSGEVVAPPAFGDWYRDRYDAAVAFTDARVGEIRAALEAAGAWERALVVVVADHGESLEGRTLGFHAPVIAETTLHVPLIWRGPGVPAGRVVDALALHVDLVPTLLARLGQPIPDELEGRDLAPLFAAGDPAAVEWERRAVATLPTAFHAKGAADGEAAAIRSGRFKRVVRDGGARQLFDLDADPREERDVSDAHGDVARALDAAFEEWARAAVAPVAGGEVSPEMAEQLRKLGYQ
jgi:arylsulfatase A-like enzyme